MPEFLVLLLMQVTIFSSITALILIVVKQILKCRIPPLIGMGMWIVLLARLLCPVFPESKVSVYNFIPVGRDIMFTLTYDVGEKIEEREAVKASLENPYILHERDGNGAESAAEDVAAPEEYEETPSLGEYFTEVIAEDKIDGTSSAYAARIDIAILAVYCLGIVAFLSCNIIAYCRAKRIAMLLSSPCQNEELLAIYYNVAHDVGIKPNKVPQLREGISPMLVGCLKPCIICREGTEKREAVMIFAHELNHYKYSDNRILLFSTIIACLYWYNPLIWLVRSMLHEDIEVLCDSRTLEECGIVGTDYAMMLCRNSAFGELAHSAGCHMSASGRHLKTRLRTISRRNRHNFLSKAASVVLCTMIIMLCLTNPIVSQSSDYTVYIDNYAALTGDDARAMHLTSNVTVSTYLKQIGTLVSDKSGVELWQKIGGNLEKFKRICAASEYISDDVVKELRKLKTDETLTYRGCALITECMVCLLSSGNTAESGDIALLPEVISVSDMEKVLSQLTETEGAAVLSCYNRGVKGADVEFDYLYTSAMMDLITSRINDEWKCAKFKGFYQEIEIDSLNFYSLSPTMRDVISSIVSGKDFYMCDPSITQAEEGILKNILMVAMAGEQENVYYLKQVEDGCSHETAEFLFKRAGYTYADMFRGYAEIGESSTVLSDITTAFAEVRTSDEITLRGVTEDGLRKAVTHVYSLGILDADEMGVIEISQRMSCGESLAAAYRLVYSAVNVGIVE